MYKKACFFAYETFFFYVLVAVHVVGLKVYYFAGKPKTRSQLKREEH